jgi:hypothetical protein
MRPNRNVFRLGNVNDMFYHRDVFLFYTTDVIRFRSTGNSDNYIIKRKIPFGNANGMFYYRDVFLFTLPVSSDLGQ